MKRRNFIGTGIAAGLSGAASLHAKTTAPMTNYKFGAFEVLPFKIAGMALEDLRDDYHNRLFNQYLPFWEKGGYDKEHGGFMCELNDDGTVHSDEKYIWYQGRGLWVYSFLYNNFGKDPHYLKIARESRDFLVKYMFAGDGAWYESVNRYGKVIKSTGQGTGKDIYGAMFSAAWKEALWVRYSTAAPRPRTWSELRYSDRKLRPRS